jgi:hypothetical protein
MDEGDAIVKKRLVFSPFIDFPEAEARKKKREEQKR